MNKFDEREKSFEKKFQMDEELQFKIEARSNKYLGEWASLKLGKNEEEKKVLKRNLQRIKNCNLKLLQEAINIWESGQVQCWEKTKKKKKVIFKK